MTLREDFVHIVIMSQYMKCLIHFKIMTVVKTYITIKILLFGSATIIDAVVEGK